MLTIITGCMEAGKTARLIEIFCNDLDGESASRSLFITHTREKKGDRTHIESRNGKSLPLDLCDPSTPELPLNVAKHKCIFVDEGQWLDEHHLFELITMADIFDANVFIAGLRVDYQGKRFERMAQAMCYADKIEILSCECAYTQTPAKYSQRLRQYSGYRKTNFIAVSAKEFWRSVD